MDTIERIVMLTRELSINERIVKLERMTYEEQKWRQLYEVVQDSPNVNPKGLQRINGLLAGIKSSISTLKSILRRYGKDEDIAAAETRGMEKFNAELSN